MIRATSPRAETSKPASISAPPSAAAAVPAPQSETPASNAGVLPTTPPVVGTSSAVTNGPAVGTTATRTSQDVDGLPLWAWVAGGIAALIVILTGIVAATRRKPVREAYANDYVEPVAPEPTVAVDPVVVPVGEAAALPLASAKPAKRAKARRVTVDAPETVVAAPDDVHVESAAAEQVAELTAGTVPIAERPWLEFAMRPVRAGTNIDEALVEIELTVGNSGSVAATDVRISTFLLSSDPAGTEAEKMLVDPPADSSTDPITIKPGEGKRIDATLALLKSQMGEGLSDSFRPIVVADARYTMSDGSVGRTSASFLIGVTPDEGSGLDPIELGRAAMYDNVGAELKGEPQHT